MRTKSKTHRFHMQGGELSDAEQRLMDEERRWFQPPVHPQERAIIYIYFSRGSAIFFDRCMDNFGLGPSEARRRVAELKQRRYSPNVPVCDNAWWTHAPIKGAFA